MVFGEDPLTSFVMGHRDGVATSPLPPGPLESVTESLIAFLFRLPLA